MHAIGHITSYVLLIAFLGMEFFRGTTKPSAATETAALPAGDDRGSSLMILGAYILALIVGPVLSARGIGSFGKNTGAWIAAGLVAMAGGVAIRLWAMATLRGSYSRTLRVITTQSLITRGPYRLVRHPGYLGSLLAWVGYALTQANWAVALLVAALMLIAYGYRMHAEEAMLVTAFGDAYRAYMHRTRRILPYVY